MHERIAMDALDRCSGVYRLRRRDAEQGRAFEDQEWPEALAAGEQRMPHGGAEPRVPSPGPHSVSSALSRSSVSPPRQQAFAQSSLTDYQ
jgi:hypothetical protein